MTLHKEINFETEICQHLAANGWLYTEGDSANYDRALALYSADVLAWVQTTQSKAWEILMKNHGPKAGETLLARLRDQLDQRGTLDVLRHGIELLGLKQPLPMAQFKPALAINSDILARIAFHSQRKSQAAARWRLVNGIRHPLLQMQTGQTSNFLAGINVASASFEDNGSNSPGRLVIAPSGGIQITATSPGSAMLRIQDQTGYVDFYSLLVTTTPPGVTPLDFCTDFDSVVWMAGTGWSGDQRQYRQLERDRWCPLVGCGPVALAMLVGWWDANGVPSAFYHLESGVGDAHHFRFNYQSLHDSDAPKSIDPYTDEDAIIPLYDDFYGLCNVLCNPFGDEGGTYPDQETSALLEYVGRALNPLPSPENEFGQQFLGMHYDVGYVTPGLGLTAWDSGGMYVAHDIVNAYQPGIVGLGSTLFDDHYALAYAYNRIEIFEGCGNDRHLTELDRYFCCNMGWGSGNGPEWHNAEDVWFGLTAHIWQKQLPSVEILIPPDVYFYEPNLTVDPRRPAAACDATGVRVDLVEDQGGYLPGVYGRIRSYDGGANWFWGPSYPFDFGVFTSEAAIAVSSNGLKCHVIGRGGDNRYWRALSPDGGTTWTTAWTPIGVPRVFNSAPAVAVSGDGNHLDVLGLGYGDHYWHASSRDGGTTWSSAWNSAGAGTFKSSPAIVSSSDGKTLRAFGIGTDDNIWWAYSTDFGTNWVGWWPIGSGSFTSAPAAACDQSSQKLRVFGRGSDNRFWEAYSNDGGANWVSWTPVGDGTFSSAPAVAISADGQKVQLFGRGMPAPPPPQGTFPDPSDPRIWQNYSPDGGATWYGWGPVIPTLESGGP